MRKVASRKRANSDPQFGGGDAVIERDQLVARLAQSEKLAAVGELACGVAHDVNNILQAVIMGAEIIRQRPDDTQLVEKTSKLLSLAAARGTSIVRRVLSLSRPSDRCPQSVDTSVLLVELSDLLVMSLGEGAKLTVKIGADLPRVCLDRAEFETVLINLAINGRDAMEHGGALIISAHRQTMDDADVGLSPGDYLRVDVVDFGFRHGPGDAFARHGAFLHHQAAWKGNRTWPVDGARFRRTFRRRADDFQRAELWDDGDAQAAGRPLFLTVRRQNAFLPVSTTQGVFNKMPTSNQSDQFSI